MEATLPDPRTEATLRTRFDLASSNPVTSQDSIADFVNQSGCATPAGCPFPAAYGNISEGYGARFRGFINVPDGYHNLLWHFGFFSIQAVSMLIWADLVQSA